MSRTPRDETKRLILDTGVGLLMERGLEGGCAHVGLSDVLLAIETNGGRRITNASVYGRIWANQAEFHKDLLMEAAAGFPSQEEQVSRQVALATLSRHDPNASQVDVLRDVCRAIGVSHLAALSSSRSWQTWLAIWALTVSTPTLEDDVERGPTLAKQHAIAVEAFAEMLSEVLALIGAELEPGLNVEQLAMAIYALSEGLVLHQQFSPDHVVSVNVDGEPWTLFAVAMEGIINRFVTLDGIRT